MKYLLGDKGEVGVYCNVKEIMIIESLKLEDIVGDIGYSGFEVFCSFDILVLVVFEWLFLQQLGGLEVEIKCKDSIFFECIGEWFKIILFQFFKDRLW